MNEDTALLADTAARLLQAGDFPAGLRVCRAALAHRPAEADLHHMAGLASAQTGRLAPAAIFLKRVRALAPGAALAGHHLAAVLHALGRHAEQAEAYVAILEAEGDDPVVLANLGVALLAAGSPGRAIGYLRRSIALAPAAPEPLHSLAEGCRAERRHMEALDFGRRALAGRPDFPEALNGLGLTFRWFYRIDDAIRCFARAVELNADYAEAHNNLGNALHFDRQLARVVKSYRRSLALKPSGAATHANLYHLRIDRGDMAAAITDIRRARAIDPGDATYHTSLIFALDFVPGQGLADHQAERRRWHLAHARSLMPLHPEHPNARDPERRLKVGFASADFRQHSAAWVFGPVLRRLDRARFEVVLYSAVTREDDATRSFRQMGDTWRPIRDLPPTEVARQIRADGIDILVDLSGHSGGNQLLAFAAKPAPVQISAWGHGTGTGLAAMDYVFLDPVVMPSAERPLVAERVYDLPCVITFEPPADSPDVVPPRADDQPFTYGCFNRASKIGEDAIAAWASILAQAPGSRLLLKDPGFDDVEACARIAGLLARHGIANSRIEMRGRTPRREHLAALADVDVALDPFPQNGGISTLEALYMGVPVIALLGTTIPSRIGASILTAAGLSSWLAGSLDEYVAMAVDATRRRGELAALRIAHRQQLAASAVGNIDTYTRTVETAFRTVWRRWCEG